VARDEPRVSVWSLLDMQCGNSIYKNNKYGRCACKNNKKEDNVRSECVVEAHSIVQCIVRTYKQKVIKKRNK